MGIASLFDVPFFTGTATNPTPITVFQSSIGGHAYQVDLTKYKRSTIDIMRPPMDASDEPGEQSYTNVGIWRKHDVDWRGGAGQTWFDDTGSSSGNTSKQPSNRQCFYNSKGINPWTQNTIKLHGATQLKRTSANTNLQLLNAGGYIYLADGNEVYFTDNAYDMNLLTDDDASFETGVSGWVPIFVSCSLAQVATSPLDGTHTMRVRSIGTTGMGAQLTTGHKVTVQPNKTYTFTCDVRPDAAMTAVNATMSVDWATPGDVFISNSIGIPGLESGAGAIQIAVTATAPATAGLASATISFATVANNQDHLVDRVRVKLGTSTSWSMPWRASNIKGTDGGPLPVTSLTSDGSTVYAACGANGINKTVIGATTSSDFAATTLNLIGYANGYMLAAAGNILYNLDAAGAVVAAFTYTHRNPSFVWTSIATAPNGIYVSGNTSDRGEIYYIGVVPSTGALLPPVCAGDIPYGEIVNTILYYRGFMWIGSSQGLRMAQISASNYLTEGALIPTGNVQGIRAWGGFLWCSWPNYDSSSTGLARLDPELFPIKTLAPAYATDLMATGQGSVSSVESQNDHRIFAVSGLGIFGAASDGSLVSSGILDTGWMRFGTFERKVAINAEVRHDALAGQVAVSLVPETNVVQGIGVSNAAGSLGSPQLAGGNIIGEAFRIQLVLVPDTTGKIGPQVHRVSLRAAPLPIRTDEILVPLIFSTELLTQAGEGQPIDFDPLAEWQYLKSLEASRTVVNYQEGSITTSVIVDRVEVDARKWDQYTSPDAGGDFKLWFDGTVIVRLLTLGDT